MEYGPRMRLRPFTFALLLVATAVALARALLTRHHVGPLEYAVGALLLAGFAMGIRRFARQAAGRA
jgi:hypothetical protein